MRLNMIFLSVCALLLAGCSSNGDETLSGQTVGGENASASLDDKAVSTQDLQNQVQPGTQDDLEINVGDRVFFGYNSATLDAQSQETLTRQAAWLQQFPGINARIEGHADERGTTEYNVALGEQRAAAVKNFLSASGVDPARLLVISYGEERPEDADHDESAWAVNRRSVTIIDVIN